MIQCNSLKESWNAQFVFRYSEHRPPKNSVHFLVRTRWRVKFLCPWWCYISHFSHLMLGLTLQTHENPEIQDIQAICKVAGRFAEWKHHSHLGSPALKCSTELKLLTLQAPSYTKWLKLV